MKKLIVIVLFVLLSSSSFAADIQILPQFKQVVNRYKQASFFEFSAGIVSSVLVHELSHIVVAEIKGIGYHWENTAIDPDESDYQCAMAGFAGQNIIGFLLPRKSDFALGYNSATFLEIASYPIRRANKGDFGDHSGLEYGIFMFAATVNIIRIEW